MAIQRTGGSGGPATYKLTTSVPLTGSVTESAAVFTANLGVLTAGKKVRFSIYLTGGAGDHFTDIKIKLNGTTIITPKYNNWWESCMVEGWIIVKATNAQRIMAKTSEQSTNALNFGATSAVDISAGATLTITLTNSDNTRNITLEAVHCEVT